MMRLNPNDKAIADNPIRKLRGKETMISFAKRLGVSYSTLVRAEYGMSVELSPTMKVALTMLGYDAARIALDYKRWRRSFMLKKVISYAVADKDNRKENMTNTQPASKDD